jgi:hypothetical protein
MLRRTLLALAAAALTLASSGTAVATAAPTATPIATVATAQAPLAAYGGWIAWSEQDAEGTWSIWTWHAGQKQRLEIQRRSVPFDLDVGPGAGGAPTLTFSRCAKDPDATVPFGVLPGATAAGCTLRAVDLARGGQDERQVLAVAGRSLSTPSLWRDRIAYQERVAGSPVTQLHLYDLKAKRRTPLRHGFVPAGQGGAGEVGELDLGPKTLAFSWHVYGRGATGAGPVWEMRTERLSDRRTVLAGNGYSSGACGSRTPLSPNALGDGLAFLSLWWHCGPYTGTLTRTSFASGGLLDRTDDVGGQVAWRIARDAATGATYALLGPNGGKDDGSGETAVPLTLALLHGVRYDHTGKKAGEPFVIER